MDGWGRYIASAIIDLLTNYMTEKEVIRALKDDYGLESEDILELNYFYEEEVEAIFSEDVRK